MADAAAIVNLQNSIALTLLPLAWNLRITDGLRHGRTPAALLDELGQDFRNERGESIADLRAHAREALTRGRQLGVEPVPWDSASYPVALTSP